MCRWFRKGHLTKQYTAVGEGLWREMVILALMHYAFGGCQLQSGPMSEQFPPEEILVVHSRLLWETEQSKAGGDV